MERKSETCCGTGRGGEGAGMLDVGEELLGVTRPRIHLQGHYHDWSYFLMLIMTLAKEKRPRWESSCSS